MSVPYGIPIGKKSHTVKRKAFNSDIVECDVVPPANYEEFCSSRNESTFDGNSPYAVANTRRHLEPDRQERRSSNQCSRTLFNLESLPSDDLPHPSKLNRKQGNKKRIKVSSRLLEKSMCVENHRNQLRQRAQKYKDCMETSILQETLPTESEDDRNNLGQVDPDIQEATIQTERRNFLPLSEYLPPPYPSVVKRPKPSLYPPGSVLLGSASLEEQEEEKWFRQLWKSKSKPRPCEE